MNKKLYSLIKLHLLVLLYSMSTVFSKLAGQSDFLSTHFFTFIFLLFFCLAFYAFFWQKILLEFKLSVAYANRAADLLWGIILGTVLFGEQISATKIAGVLLVFSGIFVITKTEES